MKSFLLSSFLLSAAFFCNAQDSQVGTLPAGKYETVLTSNQNKWDRGDIILIDDSKYRMSTSAEVGDYKFSVTAQRIFFTSGPLKSSYAKISLNNNQPSIVLPLSENVQSDLKLSCEVRACLKH